MLLIQMELVALHLEEKVGDDGVRVQSAVPALLQDRNASIPDLHSVANLRDCNIEKACVSFNHSFIVFTCALKTSST